MGALLLARPSEPQLTPAQVASVAWRAMPHSFYAHLEGGEKAFVPKHLRLLSQMLYLARIGAIRRIAVSMPPGHAKSGIGSTAFPAWCLEIDPTTRVILTSYGASLATEFGKTVRGMLTEHAGELQCRLDQSSQAAAEWRTTAGGGMWTAGAGGPITGRRARIFLIDDPHKSFAEAHSETQQIAVWDWYRSVARTRLLPNGSLIVLMTRWHELDLIGRIADQAAAHPDGAPWVFLRLPAIAEEDETIDTVIGVDAAARLRAAGVTLPEWSRKQGDALWSTTWDPITRQLVPYYDETFLAETKAEVGLYVWNAMYQQAPSSPEGDVFPVSKFGFVDEVPKDCVWVRRWDLAGTENGGDYTAGALMGMDKAGRTYILDMARKRLNGDGVKKLLRTTAELDDARIGRRKVPVRLEQEPGSGGKSWAAEMTSSPEVLAGWDAKAIPTSGSKEINAMPLAAQVQAGNVFVVRTALPGGDYVTPGWADAMFDELANFPNGRNDDQVDALSHGYQDLVELHRARLRSKVRTASAARQSVAVPALSGRRQ